MRKMSISFHRGIFFGTYRILAVKRIPKIYSGTGYIFTRTLRKKYGHLGGYTYKESRIYFNSETIIWNVAYSVKNYLGFSDMKHQNFIFNLHGELLKGVE